MSKSEDYLDRLLNTVENGGVPGGEDEPSISVSDDVAELDLESSNVMRSSEDDFLDSFEKELLEGDDADDFLREFERELDGAMGDESGDTASADPFFDNIEGIVNGAKEKMTMEMPVDEMKPASEAPVEETHLGGDSSFAEMDFMVDTIGDIPGDDPILDQAASLTQDQGEPDELLSVLSGIRGLDEETAAVTGENQGLMDLLQGEDDMSQIEALLKNDDGNTDGFSEDMGLADMGLMDSDLGEPDEDSAGGKKKKKGGKKQGGFMKKLSKVFFGDAEEEEEKPLPTAQEEQKTLSDSDDLSDESLQILQELEGMGAPVEEPTPEPEPVKVEKKKKKEKKPKKEKKVKDKKPKKPKKAKKPKPPKEPDNTPPLPKKPVILIFIMVASFLALVLLGTKFVGYNRNMSEAARQYGLGCYEEALNEVSGLEIEEADQDTFQKYWIMGNAAGEYSAYQSFMEANMYDMALDTLVRTIGRCDKYQADAEVYGCASELSRLREQAVGALSSFGITEERAVELYSEEDRSTYSSEIYRILEEAGLEKVTE